MSQILIVGRSERLCAKTEESRTIRWMWKRKRRKRKSRRGREGGGLLTRSENGGRVVGRGQLR